MNIIESLINRSNSKCELCASTKNLKEFLVIESKNMSHDGSILACSTCINQIENIGTEDSNHWRCLNESIWNENIAVQIITWRMLNRLQRFDWTNGLLDLMYFDDETLELAKSGSYGEVEENNIVHRDTNGIILSSGDSIVLIKDLKVKGSSIVAKQGTAVRNIRLDRENSNYIEGKVDGQLIVILTQYVKKT